MTARRRHGNTSLEFALVFPLLVVLLLGVMDWSWWMFHEMTLTIASHRGVRIAAGVLPADGPEAAAQAECAQWLGRFGIPPEDVNISVTVAGDDEDGTTLVVISQPFDPLIGLLPMPTELRAESTGGYFGAVYAAEL